VSNVRPKPPPTDTTDLAGPHTALPAELRAAEWSQTLARASSLPAFLVTAIGFAIYPRPWCSHWSPEKILSVEVINVGAVATMLSLTCCFVANALATNLPASKVRSLRLAFLLNVASVSMSVLTTPF